MLLKFSSAITVSYIQADHNRDENKYFPGFKLKLSLHATCDCRPPCRQHGHQPIKGAKTAVVERELWRSPSDIA
jgi:hypothetical protein